MKAKFCLSLLCCLFTVFSWAQTRTVSGRVVSDSAREVLSGVTVTVKGTKLTVQTGNDGRYRIDVPEKGAVLVFSSASYNRQEVPVGSKSTVDVTLSANATVLNDVVVIGYQTVRRRDLLASVASVSARDLKDIPINSAAEALNGRLAGVTATTAEGSPDANIRIRVRGGMSITQDNSPLYIIDGVQVENGLNTLSPQDIQSIDVLKDAAATAIYGARGANGVIIITTKSGKAGRTIVSYNAFVGVKKLARDLEVLSPYDYVIYQSERSRGSSTDSTTFTKNFGSTWDTLANYRNVSPIDWQRRVFGQTGFMQTHNVAVSGGGNKVTFNGAYTYNQDKAIVLNSSYLRHLINLKADYKITKRIKLGAGVRYTNQTVEGAGVSSDQGTAYNRLRNAVKYRPFLSSGQEEDDPDPLADPNVGNGLNLVNPVLLAGAEYRKKSTEAINGTASLSINITKNLSFRSTFGYDINKVIDRQFSDSITNYAIVQGGRRPVVGLDTTERRTITNSNVLTWSKKGIRKKHDLDLLIGEETYDLRTERESNLYRDYPLFIGYNNAFKETNKATPFTGYPKRAVNRYTSLSFFGRVSYGYKDKYLFSANLRYDGSSKFAEGNKFGAFPSGSVAWRVSKEKFMKDVRWISDLKLRAGFGKIGNNRINDYLWITNYGQDGRYYYGVAGEPINAYYPVAIANEDLRWESTVNRNYGVDLSLFKNRLNLSVDYYNNTSSDLLLDVNISPTFGYATQLQNVGRTSNKGWEFQLSGNLVQKKNFTWNANFNIAFNKNRVEALAPGQTQFFPAASWGVSGQPTDYIIRVGDPVGSMWGLVTDGFYTVDDFNYNYQTATYTLKPGVVNTGAMGITAQPGSIKFKDLNGDGVVDLVNDRTIIGNPNPKFTGGLNQQFTWKRWDASVFFNFSVGGSVYNANKIELTNGYSNNSNMLAVMADRWKVVLPNGQTAQWVNGTTVYGIPPDQLARLNANATIWQPLKGTGAFYPHSWAVEDGSFLRLNNLTVGYTLPVRSMGRMKISKLRFYFTGNNLALITNYTGYDPEVSVRSSGLTPNLDYSAYPKSRTFLFGVNATF